jgi:hypothetical protein
VILPRKADQREKRSEKGERRKGKREKRKELNLRGALKRKDQICFDP